jgi:hypothetical protein
LFDARGFVAAVDCELFLSALIRRRLQSLKKRKPERDTVTEDEGLEEITAGTELERRLISNLAKCTCWDLSRCDLTSEGLSLLPSLLTSTQLSINPQLEPCALSLLLALLLAEVWLESDRQRLDPDGRWEKEYKWVRVVWEGRR